MIRKFGGSAGIDGQPQGLDIGVGGGSNIKSIQRGNLILDATLDAKLNTSEFNRDKSIVTASIFIPGTQPTLAQSLAAFYMSTSANEVWYKKTRAGIVNASWQITEYNNVKSKQAGLVSSSSAIVTIPINAINHEKTLIAISSCSTYDYTQYLDRLQIRHWLEGNNLKVEQREYIDRIIFWQLLEFN